MSEARRVDQWGPVCRGFQVLLPDGRRGSVEDIRLGDGGVELVVATGLFVRRRVIVHADEIEAILPAACRIIARAAHAAAPAGDGAASLEIVGGIVRMPVRGSARIALPPEKAA